MRLTGASLHFLVFATTHSSAMTAAVLCRATASVSSQTESLKITQKNNEKLEFESIRTSGKAGVLA
jgi:hypothetical protein